MTLTTIQVTGTAQKAHWAARTMPEVEEVRPGVWSIPVPMADIPVRYTLAYAFTGPDGILLVDPGWPSEDGLRALRAGYAAFGADLADTVGIVVTHAHLDHFGLARAVQQESGAWAGMHPADIAALDTQLARSESQERDAVAVWGAPADVVDSILWTSDNSSVEMPVPDWDKPVTDDLVIRHGDRELAVLPTPGHTAGHLCLHERQDDLLLTGDHVLPRITSHVSDPHWHAAPPALDTYVHSLERLRPFGSAEVLPAHEYRFRDINARVTQLEEHHRERADEILDALATLEEGATTWQLAQRLTWSRGWDALNGHSMRMALAETSTHLNLLGEQRRVVWAGRPARYRLSPRAAD